MCKIKIITINYTHQMDHTTYMVEDVSIQYEVRIDEYPPETELTNHVPFYRPNSTVTILLTYMNSIQCVLDMVVEDREGVVKKIFNTEDMREHVRNELYSDSGSEIYYRIDDPFQNGNINQKLAIFKSGRK